MQVTAGLHERHPGSGRAAASLPSLIELLAVVVVIAMLLPAFARVADSGAGRDRRFADAGFRVDGLPDPVLPDICAAYGALADPALRGRLCGWRWARTTEAAAPSALPPVLARAAATATQAFVTPLRAAEARIQGLRAQSLGAEADAPGNADAIAAIEAEMQPLAERFQSTSAKVAGPVPLACVVRWADAGLAAAARSPGASAANASGRADAVLLVAAALDGRTATEALAETVVLPAAAGSLASPCTASGVSYLSATARLMNDARQSLVAARKNQAMRALLQSAGVQWAGAMALGYGLLVWSRRARSPARGVAASFALWAAAAWLARAPWPLAGSSAFHPARPEPSLSSPPAPFVLWLVAAAVLLALVGIRNPARGSRARGEPTQAMSSRVGYAGLMFATGLGWLLLLDLSANGHAANRYLALYHQGHLWLGMLVLSVLLFLRRPLSLGLGWALSLVGEATRAASRRLGSAWAVAAVLLLAVGAVVAFGLALSNMRQVTSEIGRVWLVVGAAWFFFLRGGPLTQRLARSGPVALSFWRYAWPLLFVIGVLIAAMAITRDMGPLLIAAYGCGAFFAAAVATWWQQRSGRTASALALAVVLFAAWIGAVTVTLFELGSVDDVTSARLESVAAPFASTNDQLALVTWFQRAAPADGFGLGATPWCGYASAGGCSGVPVQIHSDYTFTAIVGVFGALAAWAVTLGCGVWLHRLVRHHGRVTRGEPLLVATGDRHALDGQALLSWIGVAWVALTSCQLAVTVAGNLALLPLTGVTFPFVSFGMTSLLVNLGFLALCLNVNLPGRR